MLSAGISKWISEKESHRQTLMCLLPLFFPAKLEEQRYDLAGQAKILLDRIFGSSFTMMSKSSFPLPLALLCNEVLSEVRWKASCSLYCTAVTVAILFQALNIDLSLLSPVQPAMRCMIRDVQVQPYKVCYVCCSFMFYFDGVKS